MKKTHFSHLRELAEDKLGISFCDITIFEEALTHSSYLNENPSEFLTSNERLEFLGDAVINLAITEELFNRYPDKNEGELTKLRAMLVNGSTLTMAAKNLGIDSEIRVGKGANLLAGRFKDTIMENLLEAIVGSILVDQDYTSAKTFTLKVLSEYLENVTDYLGSDNPKAVLQEWIHKNRNVLPEYRLTREIGKPPQITFEIEVSVSGTVIGSGSGPRKIEAEKAAARAAIRQLSIDS